MKSAKEIRAEFLEFFRGKGHKIVPSAPVVPQDDPTLFFTNAGMNQFKDVFLGTGVRDYRRAADTQKCIRVSGKHNDLEEVGVDTTHHTFFEMLGNWSFGDYFKAEAIRWAYELLVDRWKLPEDKLWASVFGGAESLGLAEDEEARRLWPQETNIPPERVLGFGTKDNFWEMGETGPCGPCSEIHIDQGPEACDKAGQKGHICRVNGDCARYLEIWNLVFIQFNRLEDGSLTPLPARHVDTGMGLERVVAIIQGKRSNYDTDLFTPLLSRVEEISGFKYGANPQVDVAFRVVVDHIRALSAAIADGALPGKKDRGYVLRRILRRAARYGRQVLGVERPFLHELVYVAAAMFRETFPEIDARKGHIALVVEAEESAFSRTIDRGLQRFEELRARTAGAVIDGSEAYRLYHQDGFPRDLIDLMAREAGKAVDQAGWAEAEGVHRAASRGGDRVYRVDPADVEGLPATLFLGYHGDETTRATAVVQRIVDNEVLVLDRTPFYAESGGQVGDQGVVEGPGFRFRVDDTVRVGDVVAHLGEMVQGDLSALPEAVTAVVDEDRRLAIMANHTATHLLHWALREVLGHHATQQGSLVGPDYLRFDFTHPKALTAEEVERIEVMVNRRVTEDAPVATSQEEREEAKAAGAMALFGEKYGDHVRVVRVGSYSQELCGGTHCHRTGQVGYFRIESESSSQAGVRRIVALTGKRAVEASLAERRILAALSGEVGVAPAEIGGRVAMLKEELREARRAASRQAQRDLATLARDWLAEAPTQKGVAVIVREAPGVGPKELSALADLLRAGSRPAAGLLASQSDKLLLLAFASKEVAGKRLHAGHLVRDVAKAVGGSGGGRPDFAQAGCRDPKEIGRALLMAQELIDARLGD